MTLPLHQIDAFAANPFSGNPAAVCLLDRPMPEAWMQAVAAEMNLSETAFLKRRGDGFAIRWFTPAIEVDLCGHATLAAAHFLYDTGEIAPDEEARFHSSSALLTVRRRGEALAMRFPADPPEPCRPPEGLVEALGVQPTEVARGRFDYLLRLASEKDVQEMTPDFRDLTSVETRGTIVTAEADRDDLDFISRFFAPAAGIDEDPVTGSAHCLLAPYWQAITGRKQLKARQASKRGGEVGMEVEADTVVLLGRAVTVVRGELEG